MKPRKPGKGPARNLPGQLVFEVRRNAVIIAGERDRAVLALRHSNAVAVYMLSLVGGQTKIALEDYKKLVADDDTTVRITYEGNEAVVSTFDAKAQKTTVLSEPSPDPGPKPAS